MSELVERVARAMCFPDDVGHVDHCDPDALAEPPHWGDAEDGSITRRLTNWEARSYMARAALAAMREPTQAMHRAGLEAPQTVAGIWEAMIDEAIK